MEKLFVILLNRRNLKMKIKEEDDTIAEPAGALSVGSRSSRTEGVVENMVAVDRKQGANRIAEPVVGPRRYRNHGVVASMVANDRERRTQHRRPPSTFLHANDRHGRHVSVLCLRKALRLAIITVRQWVV